MKVVAVSGSPRKNGSSETVLNLLLEEISKYGAEVSLYRLATMRIFPCNECNTCEVTGECSIKDAMTPMYARVKEADVLIISTPIFFSSVSAQLKAFIDRFQSWWNAKEKLGEQKRNKPGYVIAVVVGGRESNKELECTLRPIKSLSYTISMEYAGEIAIKGANNPSDLMPRKKIKKEISVIVEKIFKK